MPQEFSECGVYWDEGFYTPAKHIAMLSLLTNIRSSSPLTPDNLLFYFYDVFTVLFIYFFILKKKSEAALGCPEREACRATRSDDLAVLQTERADN